MRACRIASCGLLAVAFGIAGCRKAAEPVPAAVPQTSAAAQAPAAPEPLPDWK